MLVVGDGGGDGGGDFGGAVGEAVREVLGEGADVAAGDQLREARAHVVQEAERVAKERIQNIQDCTR